MDRRAVLVVEDSASLRMAIASMLEQDGYTVLSAADGMQALEVMEGNQPDLVLADIAMPVMDGYEFYRAVRERPEWTSIPFIFLTGRSQHKDVIKGKSLGVEDYLVKPVDPEELLVTLRARLDRAQAVRTSAEAGLELIKDQIVTVLGHEMRTPLTYIRGYADLAKEDVDSLAPEQLEVFLRGISQGADRLTRLAEDFLVLIRFDTGQMESEYQQLVRLRHDLPDVIERVIRDCDARAVAGAITLESLVEPDLPPVHLYELFFSDALGRLIDNAIKFSNGADKRVTVTARREGNR
ncbi:MAG: hybrid sensor histidine kinase/response regulator, partial [Anaerolineae bacterium]|nr:hybrid sensor histidine kinase/response regulator [Anaerolineae bacterium]